MKALRISLFALALLAVAPAAQAQTVDLSKLSCKAFLELKQDGIVLVWAWLYGYYADQDADPVINFDQLTAQGTKLAETCKASPDKDIISVAEGIYEKK